MPYPQNVKTALACERLARTHGAVPATIAIIGGQLCAGLTEEQIEYLGREGRNVAKVSRRDIPYIMAKGADGATTVAATMFLASLAGIKAVITLLADAIRLRSFRIWSAQWQIFPCAAAWLL